MRIEVSDAALADLEAGAAFYDRQAGGLGDYFLDTLFSDIDALRLFAGVHALHFGYADGMGSWVASRGPCGRG